MRKILSFILVLAMLMGLCTTAFAATRPTLTPSVDKASVQAGEDVVVTLSWSEAMTGVGAMTVYLHYDGDLFSYNGTGTSKDASTTVTKKVQGTAPDNWVKINSINLAGTFDVAAGEYATVTFTAKEDITEEKLSGFTSEVYIWVSDMVGDTNHGDEFADQKVDITVKPAPETAYSVSLDPASQDSNVGGTAYVDVLVSAKENTTYAAADLKLTYDAEKLAFNQDNSTIPGTASVTAKDGSLHIVIHGADKALADTFKLAFDAKATGEAEVKLTSANLDLADNAVAADAPAASVGVATAVIEIAASHNVTLPDDFDGKSTVADGADYTFTAKDLHYTYEITATMGGETVTVTDNGNGTYTIAGVTGELVIESTKKAKTYAVEVTGDGKGDVTASSPAAYQTPYTFTVNKADGYVYTVTVKIGGADYTPVLEEDGKTYTIAGADVTGKIEIAVSKTEKPVSTTVITFTGEGSADVEGGNTQTANNGQAFQITLNKAEGYDYIVKLGEEILTPNEDGSYTIPASAINGTDISIVIDKVAQSGIIVNVVEYLKTADGKSMWLVTASGDVAQDKVLSYNGTVMFYSENYKAYAWLVISEKSQAEVKAEAVAAIAEASGTAVKIVCNNDVNMTDIVDVNDAQLVWNMYNGKYADFSVVTMEKFLRADVNGTGAVDVNDAVAVVNAID